MPSPVDTAADRQAVRRIARRERTHLAGVLARAFEDDELSRWIYRDHPSRLRWVRSDFRLRLSQHGPDDLSYTTDDLVGAAIWAAPDRWKGHATGQLRAFGAIPRVARNRVRIGEMQRELDRRHPSIPHLYLALLGVTRERRRTGLASALLVPALTLADERGWPAYVEAGSDEAAAFYESAGFSVTGAVQLPTAPVVHLMWREPR
ncbi:MAG: GNAT family N-acetyltransferase [Solirubrobacteraceae bacterium]|nr:GNAT family N-acetyltransferase [Solirubrobacteraceae bacterium]